jgi:hypothetical protein
MDQGVKLLKEVRFLCRVQFERPLEDLLNIVALVEMNVHDEIRKAEHQNRKQIRGNLLHFHMSLTS